MAVTIPFCRAIAILQDLGQRGYGEELGRTENQFILVEAAGGFLSACNVILI